MQLPRLDFQQTLQSNRRQENSTMVQEALAAKVECALESGCLYCTHMIILSYILSGEKSQLWNKGELKHLI